ncbi:unnamed protein product, partial [marine sediment metagenome]
MKDNNTFSSPVIGELEPGGPDRDWSSSASELGARGTTPASGSRREISSGPGVCSGPWAACAAGAEGGRKPPR